MSLVPLGHSGNRAASGDKIKVIDFAPAPFLKADGTSFFSAQLHRGLAGNGTFLNYAVWQSTAHFCAAYSNPEFQAQLGAHPNGATVVDSEAVASESDCEERSRTAAS